VERPDGESRSAIIRDLSEDGALLLVRTTKLVVGDQVKLQLFIAKDVNAYRTTSGEIVRVEALVPGEAGPWLSRVAVQFDVPISMHEEDIAAFHERAARLGLI
jgi:hypothetical protein